MKGVFSAIRARRCLLTLAGSLLLVSMAFCGGSGDKDIGPSAEKKEEKVTPLPDSAYRAEITVDTPPPSGPAGMSTVVAVTVKNAGDTAWPANGRTGHKGMVYLSYHWLDKGGKTVNLVEGSRTALPLALNPGATVSVRAKVTYPKTPGDYILEFDMVHESVTWFASKKSKTLRIEVKVI